MSCAGCSRPPSRMKGRSRCAFPRGPAPSASTEPLEPIPVPSVVIRHRGRDLALFAVGKMVRRGDAGAGEARRPRHLDHSRRCPLRQAARARAERDRRAPPSGHHRRGRRRQWRLRIGGHRVAHLGRGHRADRADGPSRPVHRARRAGRAPRSSLDSTPTASRPPRSHCCPRPRCSRADRSPPAARHHE